MTKQFLLAVMICSGAFAQNLPLLNGPVSLKQEWREGHRYKHRISMQMDQQVRMPGSPAAVQQQLKQIQIATLDVEKVRPDGGHFGNVSINEIRTKMGMGTALLEFNSTKPVEEDGDHPMAIILRRLIDAPIGYEVAQDGAVSKIAIPPPKETTPQTDEAAKQLKNIFGQILSQLTLHGLPSTPMDEGATWPEKRLTPISGLGELELNGTWSFVGYEKRDDVTCAVLAFQGKLRVRPDLKPSGRMRMLTAKGNVLGRIWFDPEIGAARRSQMGQDVKLRMIRSEESITADGSNEISTTLRQMLILELLSLKER